MINMERRKRVMQRSIRLGHCICDPKKPCPCDLFKEKNICLCAGERLEAPTGEVQLTQLVEKAGCASKIDQAFLKQVLKDLPAVDDPRVLVGIPAQMPRFDIFTARVKEVTIENVRRYAHVFDRALALMAGHVFDDLGYRRYEWKCDDRNEPSKRAALRYGFTYEGTFRNDLVVKARNRDTAWFAMIDRDWPTISTACAGWLADDNFDTTGGQQKRLNDFFSHFEKEIACRDA